MLLCCSLACTVIDGSSTTASVTSTGWWLEVHFSSVPVLQHKSFRSRQSDDTPNPCAWVSSLPLLFLLKPRKLSSPLPAQATLRFLKSSSYDALARCLTLLSSQFSILTRCDCLAAVYSHIQFGMPSPPSCFFWKIKHCVECVLRPSHFLTTCTVLLSIVRRSFCGI